MENQLKLIDLYEMVGNGWALPHYQAIGPPDSNTPYRAAGPPDSNTLISNRRPAGPPDFKYRPLLSTFFSNLYFATVF